MFSLTDPFGIEAALKKHAYQAVSRYAGLTYPRVSVEGQDTSQVVVVLIDEAFLEDPARGGRWPLRWSDHANLLREVVRHAPRAVFFDFAFRAPRDYRGDDPPEREIAALRQAIEDSVDLENEIKDQVPVVLGEIVPPQASTAGRIPCPPRPGGPAARDLPPGTTHASIACAATGLASIIWKIGDYPDAYPMTVELPAAAEGAPGITLLTPAPALLLAAAFKESAVAGATRSGQAPPDPGWPEHEDKMLVAWDLGGSPLDRRRAEDNCNRRPWISAILLALFPGLEDKLTAANLKDAKGITRGVPCLPIDVVSAQQVMTAPDHPLAGKDVAGKRPTVATLLRDRYVLIGSGRGLVDPDKVEMPFGSQVPGVLLHAMALDNLLVFGSTNYWGIREKTLVSDTLAVADIAALMASLLVALLSFFFSPRPTKTLHRIIEWALSSAFFLFLLWVANRFLHFGIVEVWTSGLVVIAFEGSLEFLFCLHERIAHGHAHDHAPEPAPETALFVLVFPNRLHVVVHGDPPLPAGALIAALPPKPEVATDAPP